MKGSLLIFLLGIISLGFTQTNVGPGSVSGTWTAVGSPYIVQGHIQVDSTATLTIEPGVQVLFNGYYIFKVRGKLYAEGTYSQKIRFDVVDTNGFSDSGNDGAWNGIQSILPDNSSVLRMNHCKVFHVKLPEVDWDNPPTWILDTTYAAAEEYYHSHANGGAITTYKCPTVQIENSEIAWNRGQVEYESLNSITFGAICIGNSNSLVKNNHVHNNKLLTGILFRDSAIGLISDNHVHDNIAENGGGIGSIGSSPLIFSNDIHHNVATIHTGGGICVTGGGYPEIRSNIIHYNTAEKSGGGISIYLNGGAKIISNLISNNFVPDGLCGATDGGAGIHICQTDTASFIQNNIIVNNLAMNFGGGINLTMSSAFCLNNLMANNEALGGGGLFILHDESSVVANSIFYGNVASSYGNQIGLYDTLMTTSFLNSNIDWSPVEFYSQLAPITDTINIINTAPAFISPSVGAGNNYSGVIADWHCTSTNFIDGGVIDISWPALWMADYDGMNRIQGVGIDIGPYEDGDLGLNSNNGSSELVVVYPNPATEFITIESSEPMSHFVMYDFSGKVVLEEMHISDKSDVSGLKTGTYLLEITYANGKKAKPLQLIIAQ